MSFIATHDGSEYHMDGYEQQNNRFDIDTIAMALSGINRFCAHTVRPISVAEHSLLVCNILADQGYSHLVQLAGLLHDAHEAYIGDVSSPVKWALGDAWSSFEHRHAFALRKHFCLVTTFSAYQRQIKHADLVALATERRDLLGSYVPGTSRRWDVLDTPGQEVQPSPYRVLSSHGWSSRGYWRREFMTRYIELQNIYDQMAQRAGLTPASPINPTTSQAQA